MRDVKEYVILDGIAILTANFTAATTDIITSNTHGLKNGDSVVLTTTGTLPAGLSTSTVYYVIEATTNTFKLSATQPHKYTTNAEPQPVPQVDITDTGTGTHTFTMHDIGKNIYVGDYRHAIVSFDTASSGNLTVKLQGSIGKSVASAGDWDDCPDFSATQSATNAWDYVQGIDMNTGIGYDGDTGFAVTGTDNHQTWMVNIDALKWLNAIITSYTAGTVTVKIMLFKD